jgi:hypothetical protein
LGNVGFIGIGLAAGLAIATLIFDNTNSGKSPTGAAKSALPKNTEEAMLADSPPTPVEAEGASKSRDLVAAYAAGVRGAMNAARNGAEPRADSGAAKLKQKLLAAGFAPDRADWLMQRTEELNAAELQIAKELAGKSPAEQSGHTRFFVDQDLALRDEIGDAEYARYREAAGRLMGTAVTGVMPDSNAERARRLPHIE